MIDQLWLGIAASVIAAIIVGLIKKVKSAFQDGKREGIEIAKRKYEEQVEAAITSFARMLGDQIRRAHSVPNSKIEVQARSILKLRNDFVENLSSMRSSLNSEIDNLQELLVKFQGEPNNKRACLEEIRNSINVLNEIWPKKEKTIEVAIRRIIAELGLGQLKID